MKNSSWKKTLASVTGPQIQWVIPTMMLFLTVFIALSFVAWGGDLTRIDFVAKCAAAGSVLQLAIWWLSRRFQSLGAGFLAAFAGWVLLSYLPFGWVGLVCAGLFLGFQFVREIKTTSHPLSLRGWCFVVLCALLYCVLLIESWSRHMMDPFITEEVRQFTLNPDTLFHASLAEMIKNYGFVGTGMHGLVTVHYHILSHFLYASTSRLLGLEVYDVYGYGHYLIFCPLLIVGLLRLLATIATSRPRQFALMNLVLFGGPLSLMFDWHSNSHWVSESYMLATILLTIALAELWAWIRDEGKTKRWIWIAIYLPFMTLAKISVGTLAFGASGLAVLMVSGRNWIQKILIGSVFIVTWGVGYWKARTVDIPRLEIKWQWGWFRDQVTHDATLIEFILKRMPAFFLLIPLVVLWRFRGTKSISSPMAIGLVMLTAVSAVGFAALNMTLDSSGYYFSNVHWFVAVPLFGWIFLMSDEELASSFKSERAGFRYRRFLIVFLSLSMAYFFLKIFPRQWRDVREIRSNVVAHAQDPNPYFDLLTEVKTSVPPDFLVYIPKTEKAFWENNDDAYTPWKTFQCIRIPFYIPILAGRPAIYGLPDPARKCYTFFRGYESYSDQEYEASARPDYSGSELCAETQRLGFRGYVRVTKSEGIQKNECRVN